MAITSLNSLISGMSPFPYTFIKGTGSVTTEGAGTFHSYFRIPGTPVSGNNITPFNAGTEYICTTNTTGSIPIPSPSNDLYLARISAMSTTACSVILYDRLWHCSGFATDTATAQQVTTPQNITRDAYGTESGYGVEIWGEVYIPPGATAGTWQVNYTNETGASGRLATYSHPANAETLGQMFPFFLQTGDLGVRTISGVILNNTAAAGNVGITLLRRIATVNIPLVNFGVNLDAFQCGLPQIFPNSCLAFMKLCTTNPQTYILGSITFASG